MAEIQEKFLWYEFKKVDKVQRLDNKILANKNGIDKKEAESHIIDGLVNLALYQIAKHFINRY